jgi:hypothetical protein
LRQRVSEILSQSIGWSWWQASVILPTWEAIVIRDPTLEITKQKRAEGMAQVVEALPGKLKA